MAKRTLSAILIAAALAAMPALVAAQEAAKPAEGAPAAGGEKKEGEKPRQGATVNPAIGKRLNEAIEALHAQKYAEAKASLGKVNLEGLSPYEASRVEQLLAAVEQGQGNYGSARDHLNKAIASGGLNDQEVTTAHYQLAQLYIADSKWKEGIEALKKWFATAQNPNSAAFHLLAVAYYQLGDHNSAVEPAQKAVDMAGAKPAESWLQLLLALRLERQEYKLAVPILRRLIESAPTKKNYWMQLAGVQAQAQSYADAAVVMQAAYYMGLITEDADLERLAQLHLQINIPYRAAQILDQAIEQGKVKGDVKAFEMLANCWVAAREYDKATQPMRKAADLSGDGDLYVRLAEVYVQREDWAKAADALKHGLDKGKLKSVGNAQLLMGLAVYNQKKLPEAQQWFQRAREHADSRGQAEAWLRHLESELSPS